MKYVIDASIGLKWVLKGPHIDKARRLRDEYRQGIHELLAPDISLGEMVNALTKAEQRGDIKVGEAASLFADIMQTPPAIHPYLPLLSRALDISSQTRSAFFDCLYVALAEREQCELVTADDRSVNNLQSQFPFVRHLSSF